MHISHVSRAGQLPQEPFYFLPARPEALTHLHQAAILKVAAQTHQYRLGVAVKRSMHHRAIFLGLARVALTLQPCPACRYTTPACTSRPWTRSSPSVSALPRSSPSACSRLWLAAAGAQTQSLSSVSAPWTFVLLQGDWSHVIWAPWLDPFLSAAHMSAAGAWASITAAPAHSASQQRMLPGMACLLSPARKPTWSDVPYLASALSLCTLYAGVAEGTAMGASV